MSDLKRLLVLPWKADNLYASPFYDCSGNFWTRSNIRNEEVVSINEKIDNRFPLSQKKIVYYISFFNSVPNIWTYLDCVTELDAKFDSFEVFDTLDAAQARADGILNYFGFRLVPPETVCLM